MEVPAKSMTIESLILREKQKSPFLILVFWKRQDAFFNNLRK